MRLVTLVLIALLSLAASCDSKPRVFRETTVERTPYDREVWSFNCRHQGGAVKVRGDGFRECCNGDACDLEPRR